MKRFRILLPTLLALAVIISLTASTNAENTKDAPWQADLVKLMDPKDVPSATAIEYEARTPEGAEVHPLSYAQQLISSNGDTLNVEFSFLLTGDDFSEAQWTTVTDWLRALISESVQRVQPDSESIANRIAENYMSRRRNAQPSETGLPVWAEDRLLVKTIKATVPYFPTLAMGDSGSEVRRLQDRLAQLGYLNDKADGHYGANTQAAVEQLERYIRELEQDVIDALPEPVAAPVSASASESGTFAVAFAETLEMPTVQDQPLLEPMTPVDGIADPLLQAYLYSDSFKTARTALTQKDSGDAVRRMQTRLSQLGCLASEVDGVFGSSTARALRIFQHYNGLNETEKADVALQNLLFSSAAQKPENAILTLGSSGDAVATLQKRLRVLGFANLSVDGDYGASTKAAVENLQRYMGEMENEASGKNSLLIANVDGVADPLLQEDFYADSFPAIPNGIGENSPSRDIVRLQRRLSMLEYYYSVLDGDFGSGTAKAVKDFQKRNRLSQTGVADRETLAALFNENALKALKPYVLKVSTSDQRVYAYGLDNNNEYTDLVRTMKCSTGRSGTPTPTGTFQDGTGPGARWHYFKKFDCWAQYAYYIQGDIMFHSVLYNQKEGRVTQSSVNNLGSRASHGCVRLSVEDAKWIWTNCPANTKVIIN